MPNHSPRPATVLLPALFAGLVLFGPAPAHGQRAGAAAATTQFDADLYRAVAAASAGRNVFISPLSAYVAVAMAHDGATGTTQTAIERVLGMSDDGASLSLGIAARMRALTSDRTTTVSNRIAAFVRVDRVTRP